MRLRSIVLLAVWLATNDPTSAVAQQTDEALETPAEERPDEARSARLLLDAIREDLVGLRFETALASIEALLGEPGLTEADRGEALVLRGQAHVAFGDLAAAEQDYREILRMRPAYTPDVSLTPSKAMERFHRARAAVVGELILDVQPPDATITVDGLPTPVPTDGKVPLAAGEHVVEAERAGFDAMRRTVELEANQGSRLELRLVPNARTVIVETEPEDVDVALDGVWVGRTTRPSDAGSGTARQPARLRIENLPLGEHVIELTKDCFRREVRRDLLTVDLLDWSPKRYPLTRMIPVRATVSLRGGPDGAEVLVDGAPRARLPAQPLEVCPGDVRLEVRQADRRLWTHDMSLADAEEAFVEIAPRPNAALLGMAEWPVELRPLADRFNTSLVAGTPRSDPTRPETWDRLALAPDIDLAIVPQAAEAAGEPGWWIYSPLLRRVTGASGAPATLGPPRWTGVTWGLAIVDSTRTGPSLVAEVARDGPAWELGLRPGDRVVSLGGVQVEDAAQARHLLSVATSEAPLDVEWLSPDGTAHRGKVAGRPSPRLIVDGAEPIESMVRAAWALVVSVSDAERAPVATANLALLLGAHGRHDLAAQAWGRVDLTAATGIGRGTVQYYLGRELERLGKEKDAARAYRAAASSESTAFDDEGPRIAPAARDRLADLGVSPSP